MKKILMSLLLIPLLSSPAKAELADKDHAVSEGRNTAYNAGTGAAACAATNLAANWLGLDNKWATLGTMLVGNAALIALRQPSKERGNVDTMSSVVGCSLGTLGAGAGVEIYKAQKSTKNLGEERDALLKDTKEVKLKQAALEDTVNKHFTGLDSRVSILEKPPAKPAPVVVEGKKKAKKGKKK